MKILFKKLLNYFENKQQQKRELKLFLQQYGLKIAPKKETSIILGCFKTIPNKKTGKYDLITEEGTYVLEKNLTKDQVIQRIEFHKKTAKEKGIPLQEYLDDLIKGNKITKLKFELKPMLKKYQGEDIGINPKTGEKSIFYPYLVKYLNKSERFKYKLSIKDGKLYNSDNILFESLNFKNSFNNGKAIFVMDESGTIFASTNYWPGEFHHSSFLGGKPVSMAGEIEVVSGVITEITNNTGHYKTTEKFMTQFIKHLENTGIDIKNIKVTIIRE